MQLDDFFLTDPEATPLDPENVEKDPKEDTPTEPDSDSEEDPSEEENLPTDDDKSEEQDEDEVKDDTAQAYFDFLVELDILRTPEDFQFDGSPAKVKEALQYTKQSLTQEVAANLWSQLPQDFKPMLEYALKGGSSLKDYFEAYSDVQYDELDLSEPMNQRRVMYDYYKQTTSYDDQKINRLIARLEESGDLSQEAADSVQDLLTIQSRKKNELMAKAEQERLAQAREQKEKVDQLVNAIETTSFIHPSRRGKVRSFFFSPVKLEDNTTTTQFNYTIQSILQNPEHQAQLADILLEYDHKKGFSTDRLEKKVATKATETFKKTLTEKLEPSARSSASKTSSPNSPKFGLDIFYNT
jgi:polyhydroxyalkanoate synthesis regulator phasin